MAVIILTLQALLAYNFYSMKEDHADNKATDSKGPHDRQATKQEHKDTDAVSQIAWIRMAGHVPATQYLVLELEIDHIYLLVSVPQSFSGLKHSFQSFSKWDR